MENPLIDCWQSVYQRHRSGLFSLALSILGHRQLAEDAVHDAFVRICRCNEIPLDPDAYVFRSVRNASIDLVRKLDRERKAIDSLFESFPDAASHSETPLTIVELKERDQQLMVLIDSLNETDKQVLVLKQQAGMTFEQIGDVLQIPLKTAATRYRRLLIQLKEKLEQKYE